MNAKINLDPLKYCGIFNPEDVKNKLDRFKVFSVWKAEWNELEKELDFLGYSKLEKYRALRLCVGGSAKEMITVTPVTNETFGEAIKKLDDLYVNRSLEIRDIYFCLKCLTKMDESDPTKVARFVTEH